MATEITVKFTDLPKWLMNSQLIDDILEIDPEVDEIVLQKPPPKNLDFATKNNIHQLLNLIEFFGTHMTPPFVLHFFYNYKDTHHIYEGFKESLVGQEIKAVYQFKDKTFDWKFNTDQVGLFLFIDSKMPLTGNLALPMIENNNIEFMNNLGDTRKYVRTREIIHAINFGHFEMVKVLMKYYCHTGHKDEQIIRIAIFTRNLPILKYLSETCNVASSYSGTIVAAIQNDIPMLAYMVENGWHKHPATASEAITKGCTAEILRFLHTNEFPMNIDKLAYEANVVNNYQCLDYLQTLKSP